MKDSHHTYDVISSEYYDQGLHPTCDNFRSISYNFFNIIFSDLGMTFDQCLEIGCGRSILAEIKKSGNYSFREITISDKSHGMMHHSHCINDFYDHEILLDIENYNSFPEHMRGFYDLIIGSLIDPFNGENFWISVQKLINKNGIIAITTPSYEWSTSFRSQSSSPHDVAEFLCLDGRIIRLRSDIFPVDEQIQIAERFGFRSVRVENLYADCIDEERLSPKLSTARSEGLPVVTGYVFSTSIR